jgi:acetoin utilization deacetylase AcuC-like enzyme
MDQDTSMSLGSFEAGLRSAGGIIFAVDEVMTWNARNAFVATRPPGQHAETGMPMGFCFFNNTAVAARHPQAAYGAERIAIVDFDVHHGNGTQYIFWDEKNIMYASIHEMPLFQGQGRSANAASMIRSSMPHFVQATRRKSSGRRWRSRSCQGLWNPV